MKINKVRIRRSFLLFILSLCAKGTMAASASTDPWLEPIPFAVNCPYIVDIIPSLPQYSVLCPGDILTLTAIPFGGTEPYTYLWSNGETTQSISMTIPPFGANFAVLVTDATGCVANDVAHLKYFEWTASITIDAGYFCQGQSANLYASLFPIPGNPSYIWSTGEITDFITISSNGTYTVTITDPDMPCPLITGTIEVDAFLNIPPPSPVITGPTSLCSGQSATLVAQGGPYASYVWTPTYGSDNETLEITEPGIYILYVQNFEGCQGIDTFEVLSGAPLPILNNPGPICSGQSTLIEVLNASMYETFEWNTGESSSSITVSDPGTYTVTVTTSGGCSTSASVTIVDSGTSIDLFATTLPVTSCSSPNGSIDLSVSPSGTYSFDWSNGESTEDLVGLGWGTYTVTVTDIGGCSATGTYEVDNNTSAPTSTAVTTSSSCNLPNGSINQTVTPPGSYTFIWSNGQTSEDLADVLAGTYFVTITSVSSGCITIESYTITNNNPPINLSGNITPVTSCTLPNGSIDISIAPPATYTFLWSNGAVTEDLSNLPAGNYTVTVSAGGSCTASAVFSVNNNTTPPLPVATSTAATCGQSNGAIDLNVTPVGTYTFLWSNGNNTEDLTTIPGGSYTVTVTSTDGCTNTTSIVVADNSIPITITGNASPNTLCTGQNGSIDLSISPPEIYSYAWSNGATTEDLSDLQAGMYIVTVTYGLTCTNTQSFEVINNNSPINFTGTTTPNTSCSQPNGAIDVSISTPGSYTFLWSSGETIEDLQQLTGGTYSITITGDDGCTATSVFEIINTNSSFSLAGSVLPNTSCIAPNGSIDLTITPSGTYTYAWSNGASSEDVQNLISGNYNVTVTDINNCSSVSVFSVVDMLSLPEVNAVVTSTTCGGNNGAIDLDINPTNGNTFTWSNGVTTEDISNAVSGNYSVTVTGANGCVSVDTFLLTDTSAFPVLSASIQPAICGANNGMIDLMTNPPANNTFLWSNGATTEDLPNVVPGTYSVIVTNAFGCQALDTFTVTNNNSNFSISATSVSNTSCTTPNGTIDLSVTPANIYTFLWSNGATVEDLVNLSAGSFTVTVTDLTGCASIETFVVNNNTPVITIASVINPSLCGVANGSIELTITPSSGNTFFWSNAAVTEDIQNLAAGDYTVTVTDPNECTASETFSVPALGSTFSITGLQTVNTNCITPNGSIDLSVSPLGSYTYMWSDGSTNQDLLSLLPGSYTVTVSDSNGCSSTQSFDIVDQTVLPLITEIITPSVCGNANGLIDISVNPPGTYIFLWSDGSTSEDLLNIPSGNYAVTITSANDCSANASFLVPNNNSNFTVTGIASANTSCTSSNGAIQLTVAPAANYIFLWSNGAVTEDISNLSPGSYTVIVTDATGCSSANTFTVDETIINLLVDETITPVLCGEPNGSIDLNVSPPSGNSFIWSDGSTTEDLVSLLPGLYSVTVTGINGCTWSSEFNLPGSPQINIYLETDVIQTGDEFVTIRAQVNIPLSALDTLIWLPDNLFDCSQAICLEQTIPKPSQPTEIRVIAVDTNGCIAEANLFLEVKIDPQVYIPNVFSPNADGLNDLFTVYGNKDVELILEMQIFDRWGNLVFINTEFPPNDENYGWDGSFRNAAMNPAVFAYWARVRFTDGSVGFYKGDVTLIR